jgi:succinylglutamate desuccinylase
METERWIGRYTQGLHGPMLLLFGAMHGNEPAGIYAIRRVIRLLNEEKEKKPDFEFRGTVIGLIANIEAYRQGVRFINKDLNRSWDYHDYNKFIHLPYHDRSIEQNQICEIMEVLRKEITLANPKSLVVLDIHTTSSKGGIFSVIGDHPLSEKIAVELHAPVVKGLLNGISGTSLHFFQEKYIGLPTAAIGFEAGHHHDPSSIDVATSAIINCMRTIGCVNIQDVENKHDNILKEWSRQLPKVTHFIGRYEVKDTSKFKMKSGFKNFDKIQKDQHLADDVDGPVISQYNAYILLPLYQKQGEDGFFVIDDVKC